MLGKKEARWALYIQMYSYLTAKAKYTSSPHIMNWATAMYTDKMLSTKDNHTDLPTGKLMGAEGRLPRDFEYWCLTLHSTLTISIVLVLERLLS